MNKKKKRYHILLCISFVVVILSMLILPTFAVDIAGLDYDLYKSANIRRLTASGEIYYQYEFYLPDYYITSDSYNSANAFAMAICRYTGIDFNYLNTAQVFKDSIIKLNKGRFFYNEFGHYFELDGSYIFTETGYCQQFITDFNLTYGNNLHHYTQSLSGNADIHYALCRLNNLMKDVVFNNALNWLSYLVSIALIPQDNYSQLLMMCPMFMVDQDTLSSDLTYFVGFSIITDSSGVVLNYPIVYEFNANYAIKFLLKPETWSFLPASVIALIVQFFMLVASLTSVFVILKKLTGG